MARSKTMAKDSTGEEIRVGDTFSVLFNVLSVGEDCVRAETAVGQNEFYELDADKGVVVARTAPDLDFRGCVR